MPDGALTGLEQILGWLLVAERELLLFAAFWFIISAIDEAAVDLSWIWLRLGGRANAETVPRGLTESPLLGRAAVLVPAWHEDEVIGAMIGPALLSRLGVHSPEARGMALGMDRDLWHMPPPEVLFLHRKFGGLYLLLARLRARVDLDPLIMRYFGAGNRA